MSTPPSDDVTILVLDNNDIASYNVILSGLWLQLHRILFKRSRQLPMTPLALTSPPPPSAPPDVIFPGGALASLTSSWYSGMGLFLSLSGLS